VARILHVVGFFDPAGDVVRCVAELQRHSRHKHSLIVTDRHPFQDVMQLPESRLISRVLPHNMREEADAVLCHFVGWPAMWEPIHKPMAFRNLNIYYGRESGKFWSDPQYNCNDTTGYKYVASSHVGAAGFLGHERFRWLPDLIPIWDDTYVPDFSQRAPCVSYIKHANILSGRSFGEGVARLNLSMCPHKQILLRRKTEATVAIDNTCDGHWGLAGNELMSLGLPTIVFNHEVTKKALCQLAPGDYPPFEEVATVDEAVDRATKLARLTHEELLPIRHAIRHWTERHFDSANLVPKLWDPFFDELIA
jgi:hypothetical protein